MRYKFKFWHKEEKQFISIWSRGWKFEPENGQIYVNSMNVTERVEMVQWTGLKDCNGKEIYEGDIVKFETKKLNGSTHFVKNKVSFHFGVFKAGLLHDLNELTPLCEVVGNIFENTPELINS